jgi:methyl-accepting chemotaxis protein
MESSSHQVSVFRRSTIRVRLVLAFCFVAMLLVMIASVGAWQLAQANRAADANLHGQRVIGRWLAETQGNAIRTLALARSGDAGLREALAPDMAAASLRVTALQREVEGLLVTDRGKALFRDIAERRKSYLDIRQRTLEAGAVGRADEAQAMADKSLLPAQNAYLASVEALMASYDGTDGESAEVRRSGQSAQLLVLGICAVTIVVGFIICWKITSGIVGPVRFAAKLARRVAGGDLTMRVRTGGGDEIAQMLHALSDMMANLQKVVTEVSAGARTVNDRSARLAEGHMDLSQRTEEQASTLEETASSMAELTATVGRNADNARHASRLAAGASDVARKGGAVVGEVVATMTGISESSRRIADIIGVIDSIAFQTNILALNAAVEAARAGEQGRGFAVVAGEVRGLAQRSANAAREIKQLITTSGEKVEAGSLLVGEAGRTMAEVVERVKRVTDLVAEINASTGEQSTGIVQVNQAVAAIDQGTQQNAALVEQSAAAAESLRQQAGALLEVIGRFKTRATAH